MTCIENNEKVLSWYEHDISWYDTNKEHLFIYSSVCHVYIYYLYFSLRCTISYLITLSFLFPFPFLFLFLFLFPCFSWKSVLRTYLSLFLENVRLLKNVRLLENVKSLRILYEYLNHEYWLFFFFFFWKMWLFELNWLNWIAHSFTDSNDYYFTKSPYLCLTLTLTSSSLSSSSSSFHKTEDRRSDKCSLQWLFHPHSWIFTFTLTFNQIKSNQIKPIQQ